MTTCHHRLACAMIALLVSSAFILPQRASAAPLAIDTLLGTTPMTRDIDGDGVDEFNGSKAVQSWTGANTFGGTVSFKFAWFTSETSVEDLFRININAGGSTVFTINGATMQAGYGGTFSPYDFQANSTMVDIDGFTPGMQMNDAFPTQVSGTYTAVPSDAQTAFATLMFQPGATEGGFGWHTVSFFIASNNVEIEAVVLNSLNGDGHTMLLLDDVTYTIDPRDTGSQPTNGGFETAGMMGDPVPGWVVMGDAGVYSRLQRVDAMGDFLPMQGSNFLVLSTAGDDFDFNGGPEPPMGEIPEPASAALAAFGLAALALRRRRRQA